MISPSCSTAYHVIGHAETYLLMALPTSLELPGFALPIGSEPPVNSAPVWVRVGSSEVFLFSLSLAVWLMAVLGNRLNASAGPAVMASS